MRVYISGPITDTDDYMERFARAEEELKAKGHMVYNPAKTNATLPEGTTYKECMEVSMLLLGMVDAIYMLKGWEGSCGANRELGYALGSNMEVRYE